MQVARRLERAECLAHDGAGELERLQHLEGDRFAAIYNIDGCSWAYDAHFDEASRTLAVDRVLVGQDELAGGGPTNPARTISIER